MNSRKTDAVRYKKVSKDILASATEYLGQGTYGVVYKATWEGRSVAVKIINPAFHAGLIGGKYSYSNYIAVQQHQIEIIKLLMQDHHPGILTHFGYGYVRTKDRKTYFQVTEFMVCRDLANYIETYPKNFPTIGWDAKVGMMSDTTSGLAYIHAHGIVYCDLKAPNILIDGNLRAKIGDFDSAGTSKKVDAGCGTPAWKAPEVCFHLANHSFRSDIYSLGYVLWAIAAWLPEPHADVQSEAELMFIKLDNRHEEIPHDCPPKISALIKRCWEERSEKRPTAKECEQVARSENSSLRRNSY